MLSEEMAFKEEMGRPESRRTSICSCSECDSYNCFQRRHESGSGCHCEICQNPKTCLFYNTSGPNFLSDAVRQQEIAKNGSQPNPNAASNYLDKKQPPEKLSHDHREMPASDDGKKNVSENDIKDKKTAHNHDSSEKAVKPNDESEKAIIPKDEIAIKDANRKNNHHKHTLDKNHLKKFETIDESVRGKVTHINPVLEKNNIIPKMYDGYTAYLINKSSKKLGPCHCKSNTRLESSLPDQSKAQNEQKHTIKPEEDEHKNNESDIDLDIADSLYGPFNVSSKCNLFLDRKKRVIVCASAQLAGTSAAKLTAEVMNLPLKEYEKSISFSSKIEEKCITETKPSSNDIFQKIKDIYNVCSCKVCECIASLNVLKSDTTNQKCSCKPCDCSECRDLKTNRQQIIGEIFHDKDIKSKLLVKKLSEPVSCDCVPCQCIECKQIEETFRGSCTCKPCECIQCRLGMNKRSYFVVAPVEDNRQRQTCQCSPCSCFECIHNYGPRTRNRVTHEMATEVYRHMNCHCNPCNNNDCEQEGADTCNCDRHSKTLRKPVLQDNEYDIHTANCRHNYSENIRNKEETVVMSMSVQKPVSTLQFNRDMYRNGSERNNFVELKASKEYLYSPALSQSCNCEPCDCAECRKHYSEGHIPSEHFQDTSCGICNFINCINPERRKCFDELNVQKRLVSCNNCFNAYKLGRSQICTEYQYLRTGSNQNQSNIEMNSLHSPTVKTEDTDPYLPLSDSSQAECFVDSILSKSSRKPEPDNLEDYLTPTRERFDHTAEPLAQNCTDKNTFDQEVNLKESKDIISKIFTCNKKITKGNLANKVDVQVQFTDAESSESFQSSTTGTLDARAVISPHPLSRREMKSGNSSCNSSGHDYSNYLVRFPRSTVETCIQDVINLNNHQKCDLTCLKTSLAPNTYTRTIVSREKGNLAVNSNNKSIGCHSALNTGRISYVKMCKNITSEASCDCLKCDCDNCSFKAFKTHRCRCDCVACDCSGTCLSEDQSVFIRKNENTQTTIVGDKNKRAYQPETIDLVKNMYPIWNHPVLEKSKYVNGETQVNSDNTEKFINKPECTINTYCVNASTCTDVPIFHPIRHKSVETTLRNAKAFSAELVRLFETYENANKNFDSVAKRFQRVHDSILNGEAYKNKAIEKNNKNAKDCIGPNKEKNGPRQIEYYRPQVMKEEDIKVPIPSTDKKLQNNATKVIEITYNSYDAKTNCSMEYHPKSLVTSGDKNKDLMNIPPNVKQKDTIKILEDTKRRQLDIPRNISSKKLEDNNDVNLKANVAEDIISIPMIKQLERTIKQNSKTVVPHLKSVSSNEKDKNLDVKVDIIDVNDDTNYSQPLINIAANIKDKMFEEIDKLDARTTIKEIKSQYKKYSKLINKAIVKCSKNMRKKEHKVKSVGPKTEQTDRSLSLEKPSWQHEIDKEHPKLILKMRSAVPVAPRVTTNENDENVVLNITEKEASSEESCQDSKQSHEEVNVLDAKGEPECPKLNASKAFYDIVNSEEIVDCTHKPVKRFKSTKSFNELRRQIESMPIIANKKLVLTPSEGTRSDIQTDLLSTLGKSKEELKVCFDSVRKVSDHTLIVKWKVPTVINNVLGYELLIDGKSVQKVLSPSRNMAVVTCLPHAEKLLLTVRTITADTPCGIACTSFVYRPRANNFRNFKII